jgi:hypothetical protein
VRAKANNTKMVTSEASGHLFILEHARRRRKGSPKAIPPSPPLPTEALAKVGFLVNSEW